MASYIQGYDEERFVTTVNRNFLCLICFNVLRDPVMCSRNQHCFCRSCITRHLQNAQRCPTCNDKLTVWTYMTEPPRMVKNLINELNIHCVYKNRGCQEIVQLQHLDRHEASCGFTPVVCTNEGCDAIVNKRDLIHHESEQCEYRKLKCHSCREVMITLTNMERRVANIETNIATIEQCEKNMETKVGSVKENMASIETIGNLEKNIADIKMNMETKLEAVNNEVKGLKTTLVESFVQVKDVLSKMEDRIKENSAKMRKRVSGDNEKIFVAGGVGTNSAEIFNWSKKSWTLLRSMPESRVAATAFIYNNHVITAGGVPIDCGSVDYVIRMKIDPNPNLSTHWSNSPI